MQLRLPSPQIQFFAFVKSIRKTWWKTGPWCTLPVGSRTANTQHHLLLCSCSTYKNGIMDAKRHIPVYPLAAYRLVTHHSLSIPFCICFCVCLHNLQKSTMCYIKKHFLWWDLVNNSSSLAFTNFISLSHTTTQTSLLQSKEFQPFQSPW